MKKLGIFLVLLCLSACGSTSSLKQAGAGNAAVDFTQYKYLNIVDFKDGVSKGGDDPKIIAEGENFADMLASRIKDEDIFAKVERNSSRKENTLIITGEITQYEEGNAALRLLVGMGAGSSHFDSNVYFKDAKTSKKLGMIVVDKMSWALGGAIASNQRVHDHMLVAADSITDEVKKAKTQTVAMSVQ